ncbi:MAG: tRNA lysidine(34) synthetase TilS [Bacteroidales bacterium]|nr:tRNA lysidine(34) synthetase TilS [Bacteroidales bacterium]
MMLQRFIDFNRKQHLVPPGEKVLLAVSGGRDSVTMAHLFSQARIPFAVAHCNFHLRPGDCDRDELFVRRLADSYGVPFHSVSFDTRSHAASHGMGIEEAARHLRYSWFATLCRDHGYACVATAHHRDDAIETFFLNLFRGTGIAGLHGIRPVSAYGDTRLVRPMLCFSRADIDRYVEENRLPYVEDSTNALLDARRNQLRHRLLPLLRELYPSVDETMAANIERLHDAELIFRDHIETLRQQLLRPYPSRLRDLPFVIQALDLQALRALPTPLTVLFELLRPYGFNAAQAADMLHAKTTGKQFLSPTHIAEYHRGLLLLAPLAEECVKGEGLERPWRPGDRFRPKGMKGSRLVSDFLKDLHLSRIEKAHVRLLVDADGHILSVVGLRDAEGT